MFASQSGAADQPAQKSAEELLLQEYRNFCRRPGAGVPPDNMVARLLVQGVSPVDMLAHVCIRENGGELAEQMMRMIRAMPLETSFNKAYTRSADLMPPAALAVFVRHHLVDSTDPNWVLIAFRSVHSFICGTLSDADRANAKQLLFEMCVSDPGVWDKVLGYQARASAHFQPINATVDALRNEFEARTLD